MKCPQSGSHFAMYVNMGPEWVKPLHIQVRFVPAVIVPVRLVPSEFRIGTAPILQVMSFEAMAWTGPSPLTLREMLGASAVKSGVLTGRTAV